MEKHKENGDSIIWLLSLLKSFIMFYISATLLPTKNMGLHLMNTTKELLLCRLLVQVLAYKKEDVRLRGLIDFMNVIYQITPSRNTKSTSIRIRDVNKNSWAPRSNP